MIVASFYQQTSTKWTSIGHLVTTSGGNVTKSLHRTTTSNNSASIREVRVELLIILWPSLIFFAVWQIHY